MSNPTVLVVITNYKRPSNMPLCIKAWKGQSVPPSHLVVVDNSPRLCDEYLPEKYPNPLFEGADDVWRWSTNLGCPSRFAPALCHYNYTYTIFADDDLIPGTRAIETALETVRQLGGCFASIGQLGRTVDLSRPPGKRYITGNANRSGRPVAVDLTCRCHMVRTEFLPYMSVFRNCLYKLNPCTDTRHLLDIHDDMLLCLGIQKYSSFPSYVIPLSGDVQRQLIIDNLPEHGSSDSGNVAVWRRPGHFVERNQMIELCLEAEWLPIR